MATSKKLRTPIIKPRKQGGTFYTFGSAMEDIGLNINNSNNKVDLSHYILLDIPTFSKDTVNTLKMHTNGEYTDREGDYSFAEFFQDAILNMETVLRNQDDYNYASTKTVSERVFWKWIFSKYNNQHFEQDGGYYYEKTPSLAVAKSFGRIVSGSQRTDTYGIYNETFVQIPSSYGQMRVLFKPVNDENYKRGSKYQSTNNGVIEGIQPSEMDGSTLIATGISGRGIFDYGTTYDASALIYSNLEAELSIEKLREYYRNDELTIDDIGFGNTGENLPDSFHFNAILVYYSIYDSTGMNVIATNAFGVYILDNAIESSNVQGGYRFPELTKMRTTDIAAGTSFSFRINIKPTSAYGGDIMVGDNSTTAFSEAEDFNDVIKNLSRSVEILKTNARNLSEIATTNQKIKNLAAEALDKVDDIEKTVNAIKDSSTYDTLMTDTVFMQNYGTLPYSVKSIASQILGNVNVTFDSNENMSVTISTVGLGGDALKMAESMTRKIGNKNYCDLTKLVALMLATK